MSPFVIRKMHFHFSFGSNFSRLFFFSFCLLWKVIKLNPLKRERKHLGYIRAQYYKNPKANVWFGVFLHRQFQKFWVLFQFGTKPGFKMSQSFGNGVPRAPRSKPAPHPGLSASNIYLSSKGTQPGRDLHPNPKLSRAGSLACTPWHPKGRLSFCHGYLLHHWSSDTTLALQTSPNESGTRAEELVGSGPWKWESWGACSYKCSWE